MNGAPRRSSRAAISLATLAQVFIVTALALAQSSDLKVTLLAKRVVLEKGNETLVSADKAKPGDVIQYEASYHNNATAPVRNVGAVVPIPVGLALLADSLKPATAEASLDGKTFSAIPLNRPVKNAAGVMENRPVPLTEYRAVRWNLAEVAPGAGTTVSLRARVITNGPTK